MEAELKLEPEVPATCIDRGPASCFFGGAVVLNAAFIGVDAQVRATGAGGGLDIMMISVEIGFATVFLVELVLRIYADRCPKFLKSMWNLLDFFLVATSIFDLVSTFMLQGVGGESTQDLGKLRAVRLLKITRMVRMVRIVRVFRFRALMRQMRGLILLVQAMVEALRSLFWLILMFSLCTYLVAVVTTEFIGLANDDGDPLLDEWFGDMFKSMFTLMQLSTLDGWVTIARHCGDKLGGQWLLFFLAYVLVTNLVLLNVALATLIHKVISLNTDVAKAKAGDMKEDDVESWMLTPSSLDSGDEAEKEKQQQAQAAPTGNAMAVVQNAAERLTQQLLSELFDLTSELVGREGLNQSKVVSERSLKDALVRVEVQERLFQVCPALKAIDPHGLAKRVIAACPKHYNRAGLMRQEFIEACLALKGDLSMNHFVAISMSLQQMERHVEHELVHLNKHQRKMNRRFLKLRHRLRKVYHFDGAPRKMAEMVEHIQKKKQEAAASSTNLRSASKDHRSRSKDRKASKTSTTKTGQVSESSDSPATDSFGSSSSEDA